MHESCHPSNQELLLVADGELPLRHAARVRSHLATCWHCRTRMAEIEMTIADFTRAYENSPDSAPPVEGPRAQLKARLQQASYTSRMRPWLAFRASVGALAVLVIVLGTLIGLKLYSARRVQSDYVYLMAPRSSLTPGAIRIVTRGEICEAELSGRTAGVPATLARRVFAEYGLPEAQADSFEVDYLVTPELGGAQDIRNLWPQPYSAVVWNAHVKDALEERLHEMVCSGEVDLATAQHDISKDWISAYKKYFRKDEP